jgi:ABC-type multidrug transport system fused ATPase/permease subunit
MLSHLMKLSPTWHEQVKLGEKLDWFGSDVEEISQVASTAIQGLTRAGLFFTINIFIMFRLNAEVTAAFLPILPLFLLMRHRFRTSIRRRADFARSESGKTLATLTEQLDTMPQLEILGAGERRSAKTEMAWKAEIVAKFRLRHTEILFNGLVTSVFALSVVLVLSLSIHQVLIGMLTTGSLVAFYSYIGQVFEPISTVMELYSQSQRMRSSLGKVEAVLDTTPTVLDHGSIQAPTFRLNESIVFDRVSFGYEPQTMTLHGVTLRIRAGEAVAIVGKSGSGKSTLARLLVRFMDPSSGTISIDGRDIREYTLLGLRKTVCYVPQQTKLFAGTIRENLLYGDPEGSDDKIARAITAARLESVVRGIANGLDHELGPDGLGLSGGERQRLAIARALLRDGAVLVMDEATSALDIESERGVLESLSEFKLVSTMILISHRLKSLHWVDRFILIGEGKVQAMGTLHELLASSALFRQLYEADENETLNAEIDSASMAH